MNQTRWHWFDMQKVTKSSSGTGLFIKITTARLAKVRHGRKFHVQLPSIIIPSAQSHESITGLFFFLKFTIHVSNQMIPDIVHHVKFFNDSKFGQLHIQVFDKAEKVFLCLFLVNFHLRDSHLRCQQFCLACWMAIQVFNEQRWRKGRSMMKARTTIRMTTSTNFKVKGTIHFIFFRSMNSCQVLSHFLFVIFCCVILFNKQ
mmetsp:Transcript_5474/g.10046  ORF Transcript_5474/g.10046 Transcript_5474/m.10046 type:complete len:202 (-) Transcript_5474:4-609(-)